jgi:MinD-like ATPase involved in chromosome partitioning or flagellar assembly
MSVVAVGSFSGAPGASTIALALAASWPSSTLVEADWQGGQLAARFGLRRDPGVITLAADRDGLDLARHAQRIPPGVSVLVGPESGDAAEGLWSTSGLVLARRMADARRPVLVDGGRLSSRSPVVGHVVPSASTVLVVVRNEPGDLAVAAAGLGALRRVNRSVLVVLAGDSPYGAGEVEAVLSAPVVVVPWDPQAAAAVSSAARHRNLRATGWARAVRTLAERALPAGEEAPAVEAAG